MNKDLIELIIDKDKALTNTKKSNKLNDWIMAKQLRNSSGKMIDLAIRNFFEEEYLASKNDSKRFWRNINKIITNNKSKPNHINMVNDKNEDIHSENISDHIDKFFTNIRPNLA